MESEIMGQFLVFGTLAIFIAFLLAFGIISVILNYHWTRYGVEAQTIKTMRWWYFGVSGALFFIMAITLIYLI